MTEQKIIESIIKSYISVYGESKWNGLTAEEQHEVIMTIVKDLLK